MVGVGVGRTGTLALKLALEHLLGGTCYHMSEVMEHPEHRSTWHKAILGEPVDWSSFLGPYVAIVDFPGAVVWKELVAAFPDAPVLLSTRESADVWWDSANATIIEATRRLLASPDVESDRTAMAKAMWERFSPGWDDPERAKAAYDAHNEAVRSAVDPDRLFEYQPGDGWAPICEALGREVPEAAFPNTNSRAEFRNRVGLDGDGAAD